MGDTVSIIFTVWEPLQQTDTVFTAHVRDSREVQDIELVMQPSPAQRDPIALYRANFPSPLKFKSGDVLGVDQLPVTPELAIQYAYGWGPDNYVLADTLEDSSVFVTSPVAVQDTPLLSLDNKSCDCKQHNCLLLQDLVYYTSLNACRSFLVC